MLLSNLPAAIFSSHKGQAGGRGLSPRIWTHAVASGLAPDGVLRAYGVADDFLNFGQMATSANTHQGYGAYVDSSCTIKGLASDVGGVIQFATDGTDNAEAWLTSGGNSGVLGVISDTAGSDKLMCFEARVRFTQVTNDYNVFVGLSEEGLAAANTVADDPSTAYIADKDHIGFLVNEGDGDALKFVYNKSGAGATNQTTVKITSVQALTAATWYKIGFVYNPKADSSERIKVYVDNVENATKVTATNIATATFPDGEELAFLAGIKAGTNAARKFDIDWWAFYQEA